MNKKFCVVCGRRIPELSQRKVTCSENCRSRYKGGYTPYKDYTEPPLDDLTSIQKEAQAAGMSYGKYVAMKNNRCSGGSVKEYEVYKMYLRSLNLSWQEYQKRIDEWCRRHNF